MFAGCLITLTGISSNPGGEFVFSTIIASMTSSLFTWPRNIVFSLMWLHTDATGLLALVFSFFFSSLSPIVTRNVFPLSAIHLVLVILFSFPPFISCTTFVYLLLSLLVFYCVTHRFPEYFCVCTNFWEFHYIMLSFGLLDLAINFIFRFSVCLTYCWIVTVLFF